MNKNTKKTHTWKVLNLLFFIILTSHPILRSQFFQNCFLFYKLHYSFRSIINFIVFNHHCQCFTNQFSNFKRINFIFSKRTMNFNLSNIAIFYFSAIMMKNKTTGINSISYYNSKVFKNKYFFFFFLFTFISFFFKTFYFFIFEIFNDFIS